MTVQIDLEMEQEVIDSVIVSLEDHPEQWHKVKGKLNLLVLGEVNTEPNIEVGWSSHDGLNAWVNLKSSRSTTTAYARNQDKARRLSQLICQRRDDEYLTEYKDLCQEAIDKLRG